MRTKLWRISRFSSESIQIISAVTEDRTETGQIKFYISYFLDIGT